MGVVEYQTFWVCVMVILSMGYLITQLAIIILLIRIEDVLRCSTKR